MKKKFFLMFLLVASIPGQLFSQKGREWYELKIYTLNKPGQEKTVDQFLKDSYLPALHRLGLNNIGVFKPVETDSAFGKKIYVLIPYPSVQKFTELSANLNNDKQYLSQGKDYLEATHDNSPFNRLQSILMLSFSKHPILQKPKLTGNRSERIYELRSYEGPTEKRNENKIKMFNDGDEIGLFATLNFNAVFYGEVMAGSRMPNLMYMTTFDNQASRDEHWKAFVAHPQWEKLKTSPEYQNNVSKADIMLLRPTEYSDY
jgi:hypothetical protein